MRARCSPWRCGWRRWSRRSRSSRATSTGSTRLKYQPVKVLAMEGRFRSEPGRRAAGAVRPAEQRGATVHDRLDIPKLGSLILKHDPNAPLRGPQGLPAQTAGRPWPSSSGRSGSWSGSASRCCRSASGACSPAARGRLYDWRWLHRAAVADGARRLRRRHRRLGHDRGRTPALYGLWPACDRATRISPLAAPAVAASLVVFVVVYFCAFGARRRTTCCA